MDVNSHQIYENTEIFRTMDVDSYQIYENTEIFQIHDKNKNNSISQSKDNPCYNFELPTKKKESSTKPRFKWTCHAILIVTTIAFMASTTALVIKQYVNEPIDQSITSSYCLNHGEINRSDSMGCICPDGFGGNRCEDDPCTSNPCRYNGTCFVYGNNSRCSCSKGYQGNYCEVTPCDSSPCLNGATCIVYSDSYKCDCPGGYYGNQCQRTPCDGFKCANGGSCRVVVDTYSCECPLGYSGSICQVTQCSSSPCQNNGRCIEINETYGCLCVVGFSGPECQVSGCSKLPCLNGGTCHVEAEGYNCSCRNGYSGMNCKTAEVLYQTIDSPNFPLPYTNNLDKTWTINVGTGYKVSIRFANFTTESGYDILEIYSGGSICTPKLAQLTGSTLPKDITTCGHDAFMRFKTDGSATYTGFKANIYKISED